LVSFEVTLSEAGGWDWTDDRKIDALRPCLSDYLKRKLQEHNVSGNTPTKYLDFVSLCKRYASSGSQPQSSSAPGPSSSSRQLYDPKTADKMDLSAIQLSTISRRSSGSRSRHSSRRSSRSSSIDRSHCYRCGATDHYVSVCSVQPSSSSTTPPPTSTTPPRPTLASVTAVLMGKKQ